MKISSRLLFLILAFFSSYQNFAQQDTNVPKLAFRQLSDGLSQNQVISFAQDHDGFIWVGTFSGLNKYNGLHFEVFENIRGDSTSLPNNRISEIIVGSDNSIWVATHGGGIARFDRENNNFRIWNTRNSRLGSNSVLSILQDTEQNIWIGCNSGIYKLNISTNEIVALDTGETTLTELNDLFQDNNGNIWVCGSQGTLIYSETSGNFQAPLDTNKTPIKIRGGYDVIEDRSGQIWIGTAGDGLFKLTKAGPQEFSFVNYTSSNSAYSIGNNRVRSLYEDSEGRIWAGIENGGLNLYLPYSDNFHIYTVDKNDEYSLTSSSIWDILEDSNGRIWCGTFNQGINIYDPLHRKFGHLRQNPHSLDGLSHNSVSSFASAYSGQVWIGTDGGGLTFWNQSNNTFKNYRFSSKEGSLQSDAVLSMYADSRGNIWAGTWAGGLNKHNPISDSFSAYRHNPSDPNSISSNNVFAIDEDNNGNIWAACFEGGASRLSLESNSFLNVKHDPKDENSLTNTWTTSLEVDSRNYVWVGTEDGLNRISLVDEKDYQVVRFFHDDSPGSISSSLIYHVFEDSKQNLWVGTATGLNLYNPTDNSFQVFGKSEGLPNESIKAMREDTHGNIWITTNKGLSKMNPTEEGGWQFKNFDKSDGLQGDEFSRGAIYVDPEGQVFAGGTNGFNFFKESSIIYNPQEPKVFLTGFRLFNEKVDINTEGSPLPKHISQTQEIVLNRKQNVFTVEFLANNLTHSEKNQYAYLLEGFESDWNLVRNENSASYTNLDPGDYTFLVKASNNDGVWSQEPTRLKITVLPAWYETAFFRGFVILLVLGGGIYIYRRRVSALKEDQDLLQLEIQRATEEIVEQNKKLKNQQQNLQTAVLDTNYVIQQAVESGDFGARIELGTKEGEWRDLGNSINELFDSVAAPFTEINNIVDHMSSGDLTSRYSNDARGDIQVLSQNLNKAMDDLSSLLKNIEEKISTIEGASTEMLNTTQEINASSAEIASAISEISSGATNQQAKIDESSELVEGILDSSRNIGSQAKEINETASLGAEKSSAGQAQVSELDVAVKEILALSNETNESIDQLMNRSEEISSVIRIIKDISSQTNLLALNAAIEAAQAGDAGRGFAVVAEEIRKLAEDSRSSAVEIEELITGIQQNTQSTASLIMKMGERIRSGESASQKTIESFEEISKFYLETLEKSKEIVSDTSQQNNDVQEVVEIMRNIVVIAEQTAAGTDQIASSATELSSGMTNYTSKSKEVLDIVNSLYEEMKQFKLK